MYTLWVEGPTDASYSRTEPEVRHGALPSLVARLVEYQGGVFQQPPSVKRLADSLRSVVSFKKGEIPKQTSSRVKKLLQALMRELWDEPNAVIGVFWDHDGRPESVRDRDQVHEYLRRAGVLGAFVGVPVRALEAWLLADPSAFRAVFGRGPERPPSIPEAIPDPKRVLGQLLADCDSDGERESASVLFRRIAESVDIERLIDTCPVGFGALSQAVREFVLPKLTAHVGYEPR